MAQSRDGKLLLACKCWRPECVSTEVDNISSLREEQKATLEDSLPATSVHLRKDFI